MRLVVALVWLGTGGVSAAVGQQALSTSVGQFSNCQRLRPCLAPSEPTAVLWETTGRINRNDVPVRIPAAPLPTSFQMHTTPLEERPNGWAVLILSVIPPAAAGYVTVAIAEQGFGGQGTSNRWKAAAVGGALGGAFAAVFCGVRGCRWGL